MKVLLINPNRTYAGHGTLGPKLGLPLGLLYIAASLEKHRIPVSVFDCLISPQTRLTSGKDDAFLGVEGDAIRSALLAEQPDIVGVSCQFSAQWENALELIRLVSEGLPGCTVVLGGPHATVSGREILAAYPQVHFIIAGEGEVSLPRLVSAIESNNRAAFTGIPGLIWREEDGEIRANPAESIADLDALPLPAYHLVDFARFYELQSQGLFARSSRFHSASIITSRGCPYTCTFCSIHLSMGYRFRANSVEYTVNHIKHLSDNYGVCHLHIEDDNFTFKRNRANEICRRLVSEGVRLSWDTPNGVRADTLNDDLMENMKKSGCVDLVVAAESGDQEVVTNIVKKKLDLNTIVSAAALGKKHGIPMGCFFVIGFPGETQTNINNTLDFAVKLYTRYNCQPIVNLATPLPGTELSQIVQDCGYLAREMSPGNLARGTSVYGSGMIRTPEFDPEYLRRSSARFDLRIERIRRRKRAIFLLWHPGELYEFIRRRVLHRNTAP